MVKENLLRVSLPILVSGSPDRTEKGLSNATSEGIEGRIRSGVRHE